MRIEVGHVKGLNTLHIFVDGMLVNSFFTLIGYLQKERNIINFMIP